MWCALDYMYGDIRHSYMAPVLARNAKPLIGVLPYAEPYSPDLGELGLGLGFKLSL